MKEFQFADLHCHPTLKTFGQSFSSSRGIENKKASVWYNNPPCFFTKHLQKALGITKFSQTDFTTMAKANVKIAFVSLYPFEKGFFDSPQLNNKIVALLSSFITSIGFNRARNIQEHTDYFKDLLTEYEFLIQSVKTKTINRRHYSFDVINSLKDIEDNFKMSKTISVIPTIEGAHVFNTGLSEYGRTIDEEEVLNNIKRIKQLSYPPLFMTFAHNFNNDLCGHAPSLEPLGNLVDQSKNLNSGFTPLGLKVLKAMLSKNQGNTILIDIKHMSLKSRREYYEILTKEYNNSIPIIVSHGAVVGTDYFGKNTTTLNPDYFANESINFYDEELIIIAKSKGLFAIQFDAKRLAPIHMIKKSLFKNNKRTNLKFSTLIIWRQLQHIAEVLDAYGLDAWGICCIGSDFDGTINPLEEIWTAADFNAMANELLIYVENYLAGVNSLSQQKNKNISAMEVVVNFTISNAENFTKSYYSKNKLL